MSGRLMLTGYYAVVVVALLWLFAETQASRQTGAVCTTDADCAAWEVRAGIPEAERCYGAPCPR